MGFKCKVTCVEKMDFSARDIVAKRLGTSGQEERVVLTPNSKNWRLMLTQPSLELRIQSDVSGIITKEVRLYIVLAGPGRASRALSSR